MKCPHCNQEHPEGYQYCPLTGNKIDILKVCSNKNCQDYGERIHSMDCLYCPKCGSRLVEGVGVQKDHINTVDANWDNLFPVFGIKLGGTDIYDYANEKGIRVKNYRQCHVLELSKVDGDVLVVQYGEETGIHSIYFCIPYIDNDYEKDRLLTEDIKFPQKWYRFWGFQIGALSNDVEREILKRGARICNKIGDKGWQTWIIISPNNNLTIRMDFEDIITTHGRMSDRLSKVIISRNQCPFCGSNDIDITSDDDSIYITCNECDNHWGLN